MFKLFEWVRVIPDSLNIRNQNVYFGLRSAVTNTPTLRKKIMDTLSLLLLGVFAGFLASLLLGDYSLGLIGNSLAGLSGALFLGDYASLMLGLPKYPGQFVAGVAGAVAILVIFRMAESVVAKKNRLL
jgi:uncharacterized membrane protein YeaQ/YmgE (transglycosylase-associated protein family)